MHNSQDLPTNRSIWMSRRTRLLAGVMALGAAGLMTVQTVVPNQLALADPVRVERNAPADFSDVVKAVQPAVVSVRVKQAATPRMMNFDGQGGFGDFFGDVPKDHPLQRFSASLVAEVMKAARASATPIRIVARFRLLHF
ncbi:hypothetical protein [Roseibium sp. TrichSKD4]|uniref:hypothetical protein n=1 Tax=Roseibium sp. TrichSKD4 TaxID=744980 RepID=UPI0002F13F0A|nr:hypothetical protein [Roseibium sp. TrichSKD4]